jgi:hypothetical protein
MIILLSTVCFFIIGYNSNKSGAEIALHVFFMVLITFVIYIILDLNRPEHGLITTDVGKEKILELRNMFN